ncbi:MAG: hypothetical protein A3C93_03435 [Candidatus Lloydbacteria bacterium RIFCSPHIGHO2_02_FULL_54_17]|uniref:Uncharacterized protein n=1 Tax=Candidatus Lloydbacteria bacterium RIFCSPHIGHO2_02_FULL_54_17 TaxID=1798664 RepID=A0A1G2DFF1_9BACT|nr:MAG: hypothetical protein A2762_01100 [Candidatus Lloydbacteria bacterium RIFCSPHIGHO2_01_FULL_54_11]OGZ12339.1 MAG: hypothetical protein A3C93_03435 [Candidatus Lloydbacteria bacterium RIFCSPHIGHO2_02_FULL_54_17]OGZ14490.1 MAG: hypothetical protein A3H76_06025 [Candidatus Lloydbacteria bacterium RIFCSPLOWO2_02_FULL_54_12]OGZ14568.1 MAG: hypothetical protein A2948_05685 [Candidatus Lloydbacteria bacterium RIFCSPLOWO2_01_FULL_54_18]
MLRRTLAGLGIFIALLQFPGFPHDIIRLLSMLSGLAVVFLLIVSRRDTKHVLDGDLSKEKELSVTRLGRDRFSTDTLFGGRL